jgi:hypothetical protein
MFRTLAIGLLAVSLAVAAPVPKGKADYQKVADSTEWQFGELSSLEDRLKTELKGYTATVIAVDGRSTTVRITDGEKNELLKWQTHPSAPFVQRAGVIYYTEFRPSSSGCRVVAFDLTAKKLLWNTNLKALPPISHSIYSNEVRLEVLDGDTLRVLGNESAGKYVEIVNRTTGKTVGHKVFDEKK